MTWPNIGHTTVPTISTGNVDIKSIETIFVQQMCEVLVRFDLVCFGLVWLRLVWFGLKAHVHVNVSNIRMESEALILSKSRRCLCRGRYCCQIEKPHFYAIAFPEQQFDANNIYIYICIKNRSHKSKPKISGIKKANNKALNR